MNRPISTRTHGAIDYAWASVAASAPKMVGGESRTAQLVRNAGAAAGLSSMLTDYETGILRVIPIRMHLAIDFLMCTALVLSPLFLPRSERRFSAVPVMLGAGGLLMSLLTETAPRDGDARFTPSHELSEAVADPDVARNSHLRNHLE